MSAVALSPSYVHPRLEVLETPAVVALFSVIRDKNTPSREFARHADRLMRYVGFSGLVTVLLRVLCVCTTAF
jgi:uracil phosphoribosyltransferase